MMVWELIQRLFSKRQKILQKGKKKRTEIFWWKSWNISVKWRLLKLKFHQSSTEWETWSWNWKNMEFKSLRKARNNLSNPLKQPKVDLMKLKRKSTKLRKISSTLSVMKLLKLKRNLTLSGLRFKISETNSKPTYLTLMMTTCQ